LENIDEEEDFSDEGSNEDELDAAEAAAILGTDDPDAEINS